MSASRLLLRFCLWLAVSLGVFLLLAPFYEAAVLALSEWLLRPFLTLGVDLGHVRGMGIALSYPGIPQPMGFRYQLLSITFNLFFAPALVLTTALAVANWRDALLRVAGALLIMLVLHAYHVSVLILHFLTQAPNPLIAPGFPGWLAEFFHWNYGFADKMGYTLFPFIAWAGVCYRQIVLLFGGLTQRSGVRADAAPTQSNESSGK